MAKPTTAIWFRKGTGIWNGDATANPATNTGGLDLSVLSGQTLYPTAQGTGDSLQTFNFGASGFVGAVPAGFTSGWPHAGGGFTSFNPATLQGSASLSVGNLRVDTPSSPGLAQALDGYATGQFYFEYTLSGRDLFTNFAGGGIGRLGVALSSWINGGEFSSGDANGGGVCIGGFNNTWICHLSALSALLVSAPFTYDTNDVIGVAVLIGAPPPTPPGPYIGNCVVE